MEFESGNILARKIGNIMSQTNNQKRDISAKLPNQIVGNIGLYYACYHLSKLGWNVMPTARNTRGIDLVIYNNEISEFSGLQIKTVSKRDPIGLGDKLEKIVGDYWIVISNVINNPIAYILLPEEVKNLAHRGEKNGKVSFWLQPSAYDKDEFKEAWGRLGHP